MVFYNNELDDFEHYHHHFSDLEPADQHPTVQHSIAKHPDPSSAHRPIPLPAHALSTAASQAATQLATYPFSLISTRLKTQTQISAQRRALRRRHKQLGANPPPPASTLASNTLPPGGDTSSSDASLTLTTETKTARGVTYRKFFEKRTGSDHARVGFTAETPAGRDVHYTGVIDAAVQIVRDEGIGGLYHGAGWDALNSAAHGLWYFSVYNLLRQQRLRILRSQGAPVPRRLPVLEELGIGVLASAVSKFVAHPLATVLARKQTARMLEPSRAPPGLLEAAREIVRDDGLAGLWAGYSAEVVLALSPSVTFVLFEAARGYVRRHRKMDRVDTFVLAAACRAIATTLFYPLQIAKVRAQLVGVARALELAAVPAGRRRRIVHAEENPGLLKLVAQIYAHEGAAALFVGLKGTLFKELVSQAITAGLKEAVHRLVLRLYFRVLAAYREQLAPRMGEWGRLDAGAARREQQHHQQRSIPSQPHHEGGMHTKTNLPEPIVPVSYALPKTVQRVEGWMDEVVKETGVLDRMGEREVKDVGERWGSGLSVVAGKTARERSVFSGLGSGRTGRTSMVVHTGAERVGGEAARRVGRVGDAAVGLGGRLGEGVRETLGRWGEGKSRQ